MAKPIPTDIPDSVKARFWAKVDVRGPDECWEWQGTLNGKGYGRFGWYHYRFLASRLSLIWHLGRELGRWELACHHCDNPPCCNPAHLFPGSSRDNMLDASKKGRTKRWRGTRVGTNNPRAKLTEAQVRAMRSLRGKLPQKLLAKQFGISRAAVSMVLSGKSYCNVQ